MKVILLLALICAFGGTVKAASSRPYVDSALRFVDYLGKRFLNTKKVRGAPWPPKFCNDLKCPRYKLRETHAEYEVREYSASEWVSTESKGISYMRAARPMFMRLFNYIQGENAAKTKVAMTAPVIVSIIPGQGMACKSDFNMSFYVPPGTNPPQPTNSAVHFSEFPTMKVYVRSFGGFAFSYETWRAHSVELKNAINNQSLYHTSFWFTAGYNSPFQIFNRHNEVWFIGK